LSITRGQLTTAESSSTNTDILPSQDYPVNIRNAPNGTSCLAYDALQPSPPSKTNGGRTKRKRSRLPPWSNKELVQNTAAWLREEIDKLSTESSPRFVDPSGDDFPYGEANAYAMYL
jgi:hypothetical protein